MTTDQSMRPAVAMLERRIAQLEAQLAECQDTEHDALEEVMRAGRELSKERAKRRVVEEERDRMKMISGRMSSLLVEISIRLIGPEGERGHDWDDLPRAIDELRTGNRITEHKRRYLGTQHYRQVGYIMQREEGSAVLVVHGGVKWFTKTQLWALMHDSVNSAVNLDLNGTLPAPSE